MPTLSPPHKPQSLPSEKVSKLPSQTLIATCSEQHMPLNGLAHDASNNHLCSTLPNLCRQSLGGSSLSCGLAVSRQWHFLRGQNQGCHPPFAVLPVFPKEKEVQTCVRSWRHLPAPLWTPLWPWKKQLKSIMWAHSLDVSWWLPDWGSNNARRMADSFMPAESNAL